MSRELPAQPNLEHLKKQAKALLHEFQQGDPTAAERLGAAQPKLADALHAIAREYGFASWPKLKQHVESVAAPVDPMEALGEAVKANDTARVAQLLELYPELKSKLNEPLPNYGFGQTALMGAVHTRNREMIDVLLRAGADVNARSHWWAGSFGVLDNDAGLAPFLIERGAIVDVHAAARLGMMEKLEELVSNNPGLVHARGGDGQTPLHFAPSVEAAAYLLEHGAGIDASDIDHESTPAQYMVRDRQDVARYLIARGCGTDILMAAALGDLALVRKHLDADPDCVRMNVSEQYFPRRDPRSGGSIYIWTLGSNKTAHLIAREFGHESVYRLLMERSPDVLKLAHACELGEEATIQSLLAKRPGLVQTLAEDDRRKLAYAAQSNNTQAVRLMLAAGWPVEVRGQHGGTPLHWASWHGNVEMVRELLRHRAPVDIRGDDWNATPLGWALHGSENGWNCKAGDYAGAVEALLQAGAKAPPINEDLNASESVLEVLRRFAA